MRSGGRNQARRSPATRDRAFAGGEGAEGAAAGEAQDAKWDVAT